MPAHSADSLGIGRWDQQQTLHRECRPEHAKELPIDVGRVLEVPRQVNRVGERDEVALDLLDQVVPPVDRVLYIDAEAVSVAVDRPRHSG